MYVNLDAETCQSSCRSVKYMRINYANIIIDTGKHQIVAIASESLYGINILDNVICIGNLKNILFLHFLLETRELNDRPSKKYRSNMKNPKT